MEFKEHLKELRIENKLSQTDLANALGVSQSAVTKWECGKTEPTASALLKISKFFKVSVDYLLGITDY